MLTVEILVQAIEIAGSVLQKQRRWLALSGYVAAGNEFSLILGISHIDAHEFVPAVRDRFEMWVQCFPQLRHKIGQWIFEVFIFTATKVKALHYDPAAKIFF